MKKLIKKIISFFKRKDKEAEENITGEKSSKASWHCWWLIYEPKTPKSLRK